MYILSFDNIAITYKEVINALDALVDARSLTPLQEKSCYNVRTSRARHSGWLGALVNARMLIPIQKNSYYVFRTSRAHRVNLFYISTHETLAIAMFQLVSNNPPENSSNALENSRIFRNLPEFYRNVPVTLRKIPYGNRERKGKEME